MVLLGPPFIIGDEEVETMATALERVIDSAAARGSLAHSSIRIGTGAPR